MRIEHAAIYYTDLEAARDFFEKYFCASSGEMYHNDKTGFSSYFLTFDDGARLEIMNKESVNGKPQTKQLGFVHIAFSLGTKELVDSLTARLENDGIKVLSRPRITGDGYYESCIVGIEGNQVEITE